MIKVRIRAVDGFRKTYRYKTQKGARKRVVRHCGECFEIGGLFGTTAVSADGIVTAQVTGDATIYDLFPERKER